MSILQRYVLKELVRVFLLALVAFTAIFVLVGVVREANHQGLSPLQTLAIVPFVIPTWLPYSIPTTLLLSVAVVYGRMAADNEITATKAAGINVLHVVKPAVVLGIVLSFFTLYLHDRVIPVANYRMRTVLVSNLEEMVYTALRRDRMLKAGEMPYEIYVERLDGKKLINAVFKRKASEGGYDQIVFARETELKFDADRRQVNVHMKMVQVTDGNGMFMEAPNEKVFPVALPNDVIIKPGIRDLTLREVEQRKREILDAQEKKCAAWAFDAMGSITSGRIHQIEWNALDRIANDARGSERDLLRLNVEPHVRRAVSFGCLTFVLLGCPVAIWFQRGDYLSAFFSCFLPIMVLYYPLVMMGINLSKEGLVHPLVMWSGNLLLVVLACLAFRPVLKH